jgi:hypothetical protein
METPTPPEDYEYYNQRLQEELEKLQVDLQSIRKLAVESLIAFIYSIAERIGLATDRFLELFGPLFHDSPTDSDDQNESQASNEDQ